MTPLPHRNATAAVAGGDAICRPDGVGLRLRQVQGRGLPGRRKAGAGWPRVLDSPRGGTDAPDPSLLPHRRRAGQAGGVERRDRGRAAPLPPRIPSVAARPAGTAGRPGCHLPAGRHRCRRRPPHKPAAVPVRPPGRRPAAARRQDPGRGPAGSRRRPHRLRQAPVAAGPGAAARDRPGPRVRRGAAQARPQAAGPQPGQRGAGPGAGRRAGRGRRLRVAPAHGQRRSVPAICPGPDRRQGRTAGGAAPLAGGPARRPGRRRPPCPSRSAQTGGKARPGPAGRLALALAEGHDGIAGSLRDPDLPHRQPAGGVGPDYPLCPRLGAPGPYRQRAGPAGPKGPGLGGRGTEAVERLAPGRQRRA